MQGVASLSIGRVRSELLRVSITWYLVSRSFNNGACGPVDKCLMRDPYLAGIAYKIGRLKIKRRDWGYLECVRVSLDLSMYHRNDTMLS